MTAEISQNHSTFRNTTSVRITIAAPASAVWARLTDAESFPSWNSTVTSMKGKVALGERLEIRVPLDPKRTFKPKVTAMREGEGMEWSDGMAPMFKGVRTFSVREVAPGQTEFTMTEVLSGLMLPMIRRSLPDFAPAFETYAQDLAKASMTIGGLS